LREVELKETRKRLEAEQKKRIAELKAVRSQLNPHFLFNLMNTVQELNMSGDAEGANEVLTLVSRLMGMTLKNSEHEYISLDQELLLVETYLEAEKIRFGEKISFDICIDEEVETEFISIPPMLIQPYVENAIKHGLMHKKTPGNVLIKIKERDNKWLQIIVEDDGIGRKAASEISLSNADQHNGFSTKANEQRILNLNQESNQKGSVRICDSNENGTGTKVTIELPLELPLELLLTKV
jgi:sensor histidine kinase YesM